MERRNTKGQILTGPLGSTTEDYVNISNMLCFNQEDPIEKFMEDLQSGKFKRERVPNPPPYFEGTKEELEKHLKSFDEFLQSDLFDHLNNL